MANELTILRERYREDGYVVVPDLFGPEDVAALQRVTSRYLSEVAQGAVPDSHFDVIRSNGAAPALRRIYSPEAVDPVYARAMRDESLLDIVEALLGGTVRFDHGKLNFKPPTGGAAVEWHQDWAFYPQTNDDMLAVGIMLEDCHLDNGPLLVVPGSHRGPVYDHHQRGEFVGGVHVQTLGDVVHQAVPLTATAGSVTIHHVRTLHGSSPNRGRHNRPLLLFSYAAVDAFPIFHRYEWPEFNGRILRGEATFSPRVEPNPVRVPAPTPQPKDGYATGSLFDLQSVMDGASMRSPVEAVPGSIE